MPLQMFYLTGVNIDEPRLLCQILDGAFSEDGNYFVLTT